MPELLSQTPNTKHQTQILLILPDKSITMEEIQENEAPEKPKCLNCGGKMPRKASFCPHCGQRNNQGKVSMKELLRRFWSNFSHLDSKFVKMCWQLLVPGKVTMEYFAGRQKRYPHPVQFFFVVMFFFLLLFSKFSNGKSSGLNMTGNDGEFTIGQKTVKTEGKEVEINNINFFESLQRYVLGRELRGAFDSLPADWRTNTTRHGDRFGGYTGEWRPGNSQVMLVQAMGEDSGYADLVDTIPLNFVDRQIKISIDDLVELTPEQIIERYGITSWMDQILVKQGIKSLKDSSSLIRTYTGSFGWTVLVLIALMSFVLYLLYLRRKRYYVEHFVFLMHQNSGAFLLLSIGLLVERASIVSVQPLIWLLLIAWIAIALLIAMKRFYRQGWPKTILKWVIYCLLYGIGFILLFIISLLTVFLIF